MGNPGIRPEEEAVARVRVNADSVELANALERLVEDIGLKVHLASMDVRDAWASLEPDILALQKALRRPPPRRRKGASPARMVLEEAGLQVHLAALDAADRWEAIERRLGPIIDHLANAGRSVTDAVKVVEREGKERREAENRNRTEAREDLREAGEHLRKVAADAMAILRDAFETAHIKLEAPRSHASRHCGDERAVETSG